MLEQLSDEFNIDLSHYSHYDFLIDLDSEWTDADAYQILIDNIKREIECSKISKKDNIIFIDSSSKQITVVSNLKNKSSTKYKYRGDTILMFSIGLNSCQLLEKYDELILTTKTHSKKKGFNESTETLENNKENLLILKNRFEKTKDLIISKNFVF